MAKGAWKEFKRFFRALIKGELTAYLKDACRRLWVALTGFWNRIRKAYQDASSFVSDLRNADRQTMVDYAASFLGGVIGFVLIGGMGDGGAVDGDIAVLGIGGHRSILFHSVLIGLAGEVCFLSAFRLIELCHHRLPADHSPIWDRLLHIHRRFTHALVTGTWAGVATHLTVDFHFDGWQPYKDLPVVLPAWGHYLVMDINAAASGWFGWQWHRAKRLFRDDSIRLAYVDGQQTALLEG